MADLRPSGGGGSGVPVPCSPTCVHLGTDASLSSRGPYPVESCVVAGKFCHMIPFQKPSG